MYVCELCDIYRLLSIFKKFATATFTSRPTTTTNILSWAYFEWHFKLSDLCLSALSSATPP